MNLKILALLVLALGLLVPIGFADVGISADQETTFSYDYTALDDDIDDEVSISFDIELENTGVDNETVTLELTSNDADYTVEFADSSDSNFDLETGATTTITVDIVVDLSSGLFDQGTYTDIFDLDISLLSGGSSTENFDAEVLPMFTINEILFYIDDDEEGNMNDDDSNDGNSDIDVKPGDEVTIYFNIENLFDKDFRDGDLDFTITAEMDDSDFGDDIDEDVDFTIDASKDVDENDDDASITFTVPIDADEGDGYELVLTFEAQDGDNAEYTAEWIAEINVERENDDVRIDDLSVYPTSIECGESFGLTIDIINYGSNKQNDFFIAVDGEELGIDDDETIDLGRGYDSDNDDTVTFQFFVDDDQAEGEYDITVRTYYDGGDDLADSDQISIDVTCSEEEVVVDDDADEEEVVTIILAADDTSADEDADTTSETNKISTVEKSYSSNDVQFGLTVALIILVVLAILALLLVGLRKK